MIYITRNIRIDEGEVKLEFIRSSGPGGQNVNKVATAVKLRFDAANSSSLPDDVRGRLIRLSGRRITEDGLLIIDARRFRTQEKPKTRIKTRPTLASKRRRLQAKHHQSEIKRMRRAVL
jgi:ribosome-associated protein